ncbi:MAG: hypothetical protein K940chlam3_01205 [Chlamydiae bacterium]|nr:hypothetical protein [Chlamydiota bacterium]
MKIIISLFLALIFPLIADASEQRYITGNEFKALCRYSFDEYGYRINRKVDNNCWFVKTDLLEKFLAQYLPTEDFVLISHNADHGVVDKFLPYLDLPNLIHWYGQNIETTHPKLTSIPIGLCNFANHNAMRVVQKKDLAKTNLVYANYSVETNRKEREKCLKETGVPIEKWKGFQAYLEDVAHSFFVLSPDGNGIDCHRTWEALYLKAIPIVTRSINVEFYADLPIIILDSWEDYKNLDLTPELYLEIWGDFDPSFLTVENFIPEGHR